MKTFTKLALAGAVLSASIAAQAETSANVTLTTDYVWRGISQTQNNGAIQGGFDYEHKSGFYAGTWASNVDFDNDASLEMDIYAGYGFNLTEDVSVDVGLLKYTYPDSSGLNFTEAYVNLGYKGFSFGYSATGSSIEHDDGSTSYTTVGYETELGAEVGLSISYSQYDFKDAYGVDSDEDYDTWSLSVSKSYFGLDWAATYTDTDMDDDNCAAFAGDEDYCDAIVALSVSKSM